MEKKFHLKKMAIKKKARAAILTSDKMDFEQTVKKE